MTGCLLGWPALPEGVAKLIEFNTSCAPVFVQRGGPLPTSARKARADCAGALHRATRSGCWRALLTCPAHLVYNP